MFTTDTRAVGNILNNIFKNVFSSNPAVHGSLLLVPISHLKEPAGCYGVPKCVYRKWLLKKLVKAFPFVRIWLKESAYF